MAFASEGDLLKFVVDSELVGVVAKNVFHVVVTEVLNELLNIGIYYASSFFDTVVKEIAKITTSTVTWKNVYVENLTDPLRPFATFVGSQVGSQAGDCLPPYCAFGFTQTVGTRLTRPGQKRFMGVAETNQSGGIVSGLSTTLINGVRNVIGEVENLMLIHDPLGAPEEIVRVDHVIVKTPTVPNPATYQWQKVLSVIFKDTVSSQVTRRIP